MPRRSSALSVFLFLGFVAWTSDTPVAAPPPDTAIVSTSADSGPGSFRAAIAAANASSSIERILFLGSAKAIELESTVTFTGSQNLAIDGNQAVLDATEAGGPAFRATGGGDLRINNLTVQNSTSEGITVEVPAGATGTVRVSLFKVNIVNNDGHGLLVDDQDDPATVPVERNSAASVDVTLNQCWFDHNGYSVSDRDGVRVNEGGAGDLWITILHTTSRDNGADGIEADEKGAGDVHVYMDQSHVTGNGRFDPADLDDGFDIDENDNGSILGVVFQSTANNNFEEGLDFNENHAGDLRVDLYNVEASGNREEGIDYEEDDDFAGGGDLIATMFQVTANGNGADGGDAGLKIREKGTGNLSVTLDQIETNENVIGGISVREDADGGLVSDVSNARSLGNIGHGIDFDENGGGNLTASVSHSTSSGNTGAGIRADQQAPGTGTLTLVAVTLTGNTGGATLLGNVTLQ